MTVNEYREHVVDTVAGKMLDAVKASERGVVLRLTEEEADALSRLLDRAERDIGECDDLADTEEAEQEAADGADDLDLVRSAIARAEGGAK